MKWSFASFFRWSFSRSLSFIHDFFFCPPPENFSFFIYETKGTKVSPVFFSWNLFRLIKRGTVWGEFGFSSCEDCWCLYDVKMRMQHMSVQVLHVWIFTNQSWLQPSESSSVTLWAWWHPLVLSCSLYHTQHLSTRLGHGEPWLRVNCYADVYLGSPTVRAAVICVYMRPSRPCKHTSSLYWPPQTQQASCLVGTAQFGLKLIRIKNINFSWLCAGPTDCRSKCKKSNVYFTLLEHLVWSTDCYKKRLQSDMLWCLQALKQSLVSPCWPSLRTTHPMLSGLAAFVYICVCSRQNRTTLAPMLVWPLPSHGMDAETGICGGAKGTELAWAMLVWEERWSMSSELWNKTRHTNMFKRDV